MDTLNSARVFEMDTTIAPKGKYSRTSKCSTSTAMSEALNDAEGIKQPLPLASRVKDAGKEFLKYNQTCHWIQHMMADAPEPRNDRKFRGKRVLNNEKSNFFADNKEQIKVPSFTQPPVEEPAHYGDQLKILQQQQDELLERRLKEQFEINKTQRQVPVKEEADVSISRSQHRSDDDSKVDPKRNSSDNGLAIGPPVQNRRRLKGDLAQSCAVRDEGSIGTLIWQTKAPVGVERDCLKQIHGSYVKPLNSTLGDRLYPRRQVAPSSMSQFLSNNTDTCSCTSSAKMSECSTIIPTEVTTSERDEDKWSDNAKTPKFSASVPERPEHYPCECERDCYYNIQTPVIEDALRVSQIQE